MEGDDTFWEKWVKNPLENTQEGPRLNPQAIREVAEKANYEGASKVREITSIMEKGAKLGIEGEGIDGPVSRQITPVLMNTGKG